MTLKDRINDDLKQAMLSRDAFKVDTLRTIKGVVLNEEVAKGVREQGLDDASLESLLQKEVKKRYEAADLFDQGGNHESAEKERKEAELISQYLPEQMDEAEIAKLIDEVIIETGANSMQQMGQVIGAVKAKAGNAADGAVIAKLVKERLQ